MSVIWYLGFALGRERRPGLVSEWKGVEEAFFGLGLGLGFFLEFWFSGLVKKVKGLKGWSWEVEGIMVSQIMAEEGG